MTSAREASGIQAMADQTTIASFEHAFAEITGRKPFPWQSALFARLTSVNDEQEPDIPAIASIPTGLGKTSVIAVWLIALSQGMPLPRRLVYVVNRRTVVDQTTREAERLKAAVEDGKLPGIDRLAISTLRGQYADNGAWSADPSRPAVVCGTVDMIGSRLLFAGYRIGFKSRPLHAGFLGQDALLIHDEAHLEPAFQQLVTDIEREQQRERDRHATQPWPRLRVMALSATARNESEETSFTLTEEERHPPADLTALSTEPIHHVWRRLKATKALRLHSIEDEAKELTSTTTDLAFEHSQSNDAILIFLRSVKMVEETATSLRKRLKQAGLAQHVATLTGTMRGLERDELVNDPVFIRFLPPSDRPDEVTPADGTAYLACTSAGEVGVNLSADHMVCDLTTFDSMAQRLGRVNRFGLRDDTRVDVVVNAKLANAGAGANASPLEKAIGATYSIFRRWIRRSNGQANVSPLNICRSAAGQLRSFAPAPHILRSSDILFDAWALTSIRTTMPGRPPVAPYLHGVSEWEQPRTSVAWREEVEVIKPALIERESQGFLQGLLSDYALKPHELLSDRSDRVLKILQDIAKRIGQDADHLTIWIVDNQNQIEPITLAELLTGDRQQVLGRIEHQTLLLPPSAGGISDGILNGRVAQANDVADQWHDDQNRQRRARLWDGEDPPDGMALIRTIDTDPDADENAPSQAEVDDATEGGPATRPRRRFWHWYARPADADNPTRASLRPIGWEHHTNDVVDNARRILAGLDLPQPLHQAVELAAEWHDLGKKRELWQRSIGNPDSADWYAKPGKPESGRRWRPRHISDYRHEFGSLLDLLDVSQTYHERLASLDPDQQDLVLHLIAAHHGRARPHFTDDEMADPDHPQSFAEEAAIETMRRYARLQRRYGRWGLAYLESLLRAADWAASAAPSATPTHEEVAL